MEKFNEIIQKLNNLETVFIQQKTVLNLDEVAAFTGLSKSCIYKKTSTGGIPCYKPTNKQLFFNRNEIEKWLLSNRKPTSEEIETDAINYCLTNKRGGGK